MAQAASAIGLSARGPTYAVALSPGPRYLPGCSGAPSPHAKFAILEKKLWQDSLEVILEKLERLVPLHSSPTPPTRFSRMCPHVSWSRPKNPLQRPGVSLSCPDLLL